MKISHNPHRLRLYFIGLLLIGVTSGLISRLIFRDAQVRVEWTTASELNTAGFNLYRSDSEEGDFTKINLHLIPASTDPLTGGRYRYIDRQVKAGVTYYYQLEEVEYDGSSSRYGPIVVQAASEGKWGLILSGVLAVLGFMGLIYTRFYHRS